jgi:hypothetical protein
MEIVTGPDSVERIETNDEANRQATPKFTGSAEAWRAFCRPSGQSEDWAPTTRVSLAGDAVAVRGVTPFTIPRADLALTTDEAIRQAEAVDFAVLPYAGEVR